MDKDVYQRDKDALGNYPIDNVGVPVDLGDAARLMDSRAVGGVWCPLPTPLVLAAPGVETIVDSVPIDFSAVPKATLNPAADISFGVRYENPGLVLPPGTAVVWRVRETLLLPPVGTVPAALGTLLHIFATQLVASSLQRYISSVITSVPIPAGGVKIYQLTAEAVVAGFSLRDIIGRFDIFPQP